MQLDWNMRVAKLVMIGNQYHGVIKATLEKMLQSKVYRGYEDAEPVQA